MEKLFTSAENLMCFNDGKFVFDLKNRQFLAHRNVNIEKHDIANEIEKLSS